MKGAVADSITHDSIMADSVMSDSAVVDSVVAGSEQMGIVLVDPVATVEPLQVEASDGGYSWIYMILVVLFSAVGLRFHNSPRYVKALLGDLIETRTRNNVFDDTVRETSLMVLLDVLWCACGGVLLWKSLVVPEWAPMGIPEGARPLEGMLLCMGMCVAYTVFLMMAYWVTGNVFSNAASTSSWLKGASASMGIQTVILLPMALLVLSQPQWNTVVLPIALGAFILGKITFIIKGFRIFFNRFSSCLLFLYYLCGLEIVPLIMTYVLTLYLSGIML